jgi:hypothetical protein
MAVSARAVRLACLVGLGATLPGVASAVPIDKVVYVRPVAVCDNAGNNCTDVNQLLTLSSQATKDIWKQAGYDVVFLPGRTGAGQTVNSSALLSIDSEAEARNLIRDNVLDINSTVIEAFLVNSISTSSGAAYGWGFIDNPGIIISTQTLAANRMDTLAHEIGHNFGLDHATFGNNPPAANNLMSPLRTVPNALNQLAGNGGTLDALNNQQVTEARNGVTVDPTSSIGQATGRITAAPAALNCALLIVPTTTCSTFNVVSTGAGSFVRAIEITIPGLGSADAQATTLRNLLDTTSGVSSGGSATGESFSFSYTFDAVGDIFTITFLDRGFTSGLDFDLITGFGGGQANQFRFYFSDGYEVAVGYDGIFADSQDPEDFLESTFRGAVPETGDINTVLPSPIVAGTISGPFDLADPLLVPEPGTLALMLSAFAALGAIARRRTGRCSEQPKG